MLVTLAERAAACAPAACGAVTTLSYEEGGEPGPAEAEPPSAVTHPDLAALVDVQWEEGEGPIPTAIRTGEPAVAEDLLGEERWPAYRTAALAAGLRSSTTLPFRRDGMTVTVTLCGFRPGFLDEQTRTAATLVGDLAAQALLRDHQWKQARTEAEQLDNALRSRPVVDQACGILMHILGCDADAAFALLRRRSQRTNTRLLDLAHEVVRTRGRGFDAAFPAAGTR
ncbi:ANTAR domain-containing protein [Streptomyces hoynatensis]|uniref:ANTAR domain-containing protein n=2 Tax=Streptomyces hoynatensis TaxID=1141874 RepID=A0A3A9YW11_9ACTN|nr:ANTAR domain-containing protein [Streptomyces hoynatensis]